MPPLLESTLENKANSFTSVELEVQPLGATLIVLGGSALGTHLGMHEIICSGVSFEEGLQASARTVVKVT